jgi:hypothetical protein
MCHPPIIEPLAVVGSVLLHGLRTNAKHLKRCRIETLDRDLVSPKEPAVPANFDLIKSQATEALAQLWHDRC